MSARITLLLAYAFGSTLCAFARPPAIKLVAKSPSSETIVLRVTNLDPREISFCLTDDLSPSAHMEVAPFHLEYFSDGKWSARLGSDVAMHVIGTIAASETMSFTIRRPVEPGRYRAVLVYTPTPIRPEEEKGCAGLMLHNHTSTHSPPFNGLLLRRP